MNAIISCALFLTAPVMNPQVNGFGQPGPREFEPAVRWGNLMHGDDSAITRPEAVVLSREQDWEQYWKRMCNVPPTNYLQAPPVANFMFEDLVVIHAGTQRTGGFVMQVDRISRPHPHQWVLHWVLFAPGRGVAVTQAQTSPFVIIRVQRTVGIPHFQGRTISYTGWPGYGTCGPQSQPPVYIVGKGGVLIPYDPAKNGKKEGS